MRLHHEYRVPRVFIMENGAPVPETPDSQGYVDNPRRIDYIRRHLVQVHHAIAEGAPVEGYVVWSLTDNWECEWGYKALMGLVRVERPSLRRIIKASGYWYRDLIAANALPVD